jgi:hypothetical protein
MDALDIEKWKLASSRYLSPVGMIDFEGLDIPT